MQDYIERKRLTILRIIQENDGPISSQGIADRMDAMGFDIPERTVRFDLLNLDREGFTEYLRKKGRIITRKGTQELNKARVFDKLGFLTAKIDQMTYEMSFDLPSRKGTVLINLSLLAREYLKEAIPLMQRVYEHGLSMGSLITILEPGQQFEGAEIPEGYVGIGTVCSITINGILLSNGIPTRSKYGGLLELEESKPTRFVALINYEGTTLDPLEIFIKSGMTNYLGATSSGNGQIGASIREMPFESRERVVRVSEELKEAGLGAFMLIGNYGTPICGVPVSAGAFGSIVIGGLNPVAILVESGMPVTSKAMAGLIDYGRLFHYTELDRYL